MLPDDFQYFPVVADSLLMFVQCCRRCLSLLCLDPLFHVFPVIDSPLNFKLF
jgi:hypothetical protein